MDSLRDLKAWISSKWGYNGGLIERDSFLEFKTVPINSWIPSLGFSLFFLIVGVFILRRAPAHWYVTVVLWTFAGVLLAKTKHGLSFLLIYVTKKVIYTFDKVEGNLLVVVYSIIGRTAQDYWLDEIEHLDIQETHDLQAWTSDVTIYLHITEGRRIKLFAGQTFGIRKELKYFIHEKLISFLNLSESGRQRYSSRRTRVRFNSRETRGAGVGDLREARSSSASQSSERLGRRERRSSNSSHFDEFVGDEKSDSSLVIPLDPL